MSEHIAGVSPKEYNGRRYRSTFEADTAEALDKMGLPWEYETKKITLQEGFHCQYQKDKVRSIDYIPDFTVGPIMLEMKGYETPDWKIKKKMLYKYLTENEPGAIFYVIKNFRQLLQSLDNHWQFLGCAIKVTSKKNPSEPVMYDSIAQAMEELGLKGKSLTPVFRTITGTKDYAYGYNFKVVKLNL